MIPQNLEFGDSFRSDLSKLITFRRDVRRFRPDSLPEGLLEELLHFACLAPSVGFSQPWRWVTVDAPERRAAIRENFRQCNQSALADFEGERAALYARLKLSGLTEAPVHLAVFADPSTLTGGGLGRKTMPEMLNYSVVCAVHTLWLAARSHGIGIRWVSILNPDQVRIILEVAPEWQLIAYLCIGFPEFETDDPELRQQGWAERHPSELVHIKR